MNICWRCPLFLSFSSFCLCFWCFWNLFWTPRPPCSQPITNHLSRDSSWKVVTCMHLLKMSMFFVFFFVFLSFLSFLSPRPAPNPLPITFRVTHPERLWAIIKTVREILKYLDFCICWIKLGFYWIIFSLTSWFHQSSICNEKYAFLALLFHFWRCRKNKNTQLTKKNIHCSVLTSLRDIS